MSRKSTNVRLTFSLNSDEFKQQMKEAQRAIREIDSEFTLAQAEAKAFGKETDVTRASIAGLTEKINKQREVISLAQTEYKLITDKLEKLKELTPQLEEKVKSATEAYEKSKKELGENAEVTKKLYDDLGKAKWAYAENQNSIEKYTDTQSNMKVATDKSRAALADMQGEVKKLNEELARAPWDKFAAGCKKASDVVGKIGKGLSVASGAVVGLGASSAKAAIEYESAFAGVKKTVDATDEELAVISDGIKAMSKEIPATTTEIAGVAEAAGQLGIATEDILDFSRVMIDLGASTNLSSQEAASALAKFANVTQMEAKNYQNLGSVIVSLGNHFATTEADIVSMATRLASTGEIVGLSEPQIMAVATALSSVGIEAEAGGSAVAKLLKKMETSVSTYDKSRDAIAATGKNLRELQMMQSHDSKGFKAIAEGLGLTSTELSGFVANVAGLEQFASVAGKSADEFIAAWGKDAVSALDMFISGLGDTGRNGANAISILQDMGLTEVRMSNAILALSSSGGVLTQALDDANTAWEENNALANEATQRYATTESQIQITKNNITSLMQSLGEKLLPTLERVLNKVKDLADRFSGLTDAQQNTIIKVGAGIAVAGPAVVALSKLIGAVGTVSKAVGFVSAKLAGAGGLTGALGAIASPAALAVGAIAGIAAGLAYVYTKNEDVRNGVNAAITHLGESVQPLLEFFRDTVLPGLGDAWNGLLDILKPFGDFLEGVFVSIWQDMLTPAIEWVASTLIPQITETAENLWNNVLVPLGEFLGSVLSPVIEVLSDWLTLLWEDVIVPLADCVGGVLAAAWEGLCDLFNDILIPAVNKVISRWQAVWDKLQPFAQWLGKTFKPVVQGLFSYIKTSLGSLKGIFSGLIEFITGVFSGDWDKALGGVKKIASSWWTGVKKIFTNLWDFVKGIGKKLKSVFDFKWELPKIKLPHFKVEWDTEGALAKAAQFLGLQGMPKIGVEWYRSGGIMTEPTLFGAANGKLLGGGEAGPEAILPLSEFYTRLSALLEEKFRRWEESHDPQVIVYVTLDGEVIAVKTAGRVEDRLVQEWRRRRA